MTVPERCPPIILIEIEAVWNCEKRAWMEWNKPLYSQRDRRMSILYERCKNNDTHSKLVPCCWRELLDCCGPTLLHHTGAEKLVSFQYKLLEFSMHIPLLHPWRKLFLWPLFCHDPVLLALSLSQLLLDLAASSLVGMKEGLRSRWASWKLNCQVTCFFAVHGGYNIVIWPFFGFEYGSLRCRLNFSWQILANKLEVCKNGPK